MDIRLSRPCVEDPTHFIAECHLGKKVDIEKSCRLLRSMGVTELRCSVRLGVARFELEGRSVMIYQSGRVDIRRIRNINDAREMMGQIAEIVFDALSDTSF
jgi:ArsR family metal-binding transcriptional regulator